jgi:hypothetical protein
VTAVVSFGRAADLLEDAMVGHGAAVMAMKGTRSLVPDGSWKSVFMFAAAESVE